MANLPPADAGIQGEVNFDRARPKLEPQVTTISVASTSSQLSTSDDFPSIGITELLDIDDRPTFILDLRKAAKEGPVYYNTSLGQLKVLGQDVGRQVLDSYTNKTVDLKIQAFLDWTVTTSENGMLPVKYLGVRWSANTLRGRWRIICGALLSSYEDTDTNSAASTETPRIARHSTVPIAAKHPIDAGKPPFEPLEDQLHPFRLRREDTLPVFPSSEGNTVSANNRYQYESLGPFDLTAPNPTMPLNTHLQFFLAFDWAATELGPISVWPLDLRRMCNILMSDPRPAAMYWGKERTMMYNEPYRVVTGQKHPGMMGKIFSEAWAEVEDDFIPAFEKAYATGESYGVDDARFYIDRSGYLEETYYSISMIPFSSEDGQLAFYNPVFDTTRQVIADRRMAFLLRLGQFIASSGEPKDFWRQLLLGLDIENPDIPFALLYSAGGDINETLSVSSEQSANLRNWVLEGAVRVPETCIESRRRFGTDNSMQDFIPSFLELVTAEAPTLLRESDGTLPKFMSTDIPVLGGSATCDAAVFLPIRSTGDNVVGFLIIGVNPRKRFDDDYNIFVELLSRQLATSMASALLLEEEIRRGRLVAEQADRDRSLLSKKLAIQTHEAIEIESRFRRMADLAPVGMFHIDPSGVLIYANNDYYNLTEHPRDVSYPMSWYSAIAEIDHPIMDKEWAKLTAGEPVSFELRLRKRFVAEEIVGDEKVMGYTWIIAAAYPEKAADGTVIGVLGCLTDISRQKWAEDFQNRKMLEAIEVKRQQENFIDMTSHEMRNPLSAIIQCADWIGTSIAKFRTHSDDVTMPAEVVESYADSANTIVLCAQHQTRIIDDILTLSKLDSDLLIITPVEVQPISVIETMLKMFNGELQKSDIDCKFTVEESYSDLLVDWVKLDPSRLLQVLINLVTNAIKFTQSQPKRMIEISLGASLDHPPINNGVQYLPRGTDRRDMSQGPLWGTGEAVYLHVGVKDTGRGLDDLERNLLFKRFSQTSPRTHVQYGGSGLGLFISRELAELQGGQIGVASKAGEGSTFAFYVRSRRCDPPSTPISTAPFIMKEHTRTIGESELSRIQNGSPLPTHLGSQNKKVSDIPTPPKHVLIVEDNIVNQKVLSKQLRSAGCVVSVANHGKEALDFLANSRFWNGKETSGTHLSVVLMDLEMPVMDGLTCVKMIRELQGEGKIVAHVPVIAVTANARSEQIITAKEAGMDSVVTKPFRIPELIPEIEKQLRAGAEKREVIERSISAPPQL